MPNLQATWVPEGGFFFWSAVEEAIEDVAPRELPGLARPGVARSASRSLAVPGSARKRSRVAGLDVDIANSVALFGSVSREARVSQSIRCWSYATFLSLELATGRRVVPSVREGRACWRALLTRKRDRDRFETLARALPTNAHAIPTTDRGNVRLNTPDYSLRAFLDAAVDALYRQSAYPGTARGWVLEFADALRGEDASFSPRDARYQGIPAMLATWSSEAGARGLKVGFRLGLPKKTREHFKLRLFVHGADDPTRTTPMSRAWKAGDTLLIGKETFHHPAHFALWGLARASRIYPPLAACLDGAEPTELKWSAERTWEFLSSGASSLRDAGFEVHLPDEFGEAGQHRVRARMCIEGAAGDLDLSELLRFRWEVVLGGAVIDGSDFAELLGHKQPIVRFRGQWVMLDPADIARLPDDMQEDGEIPTAEALRAVLTGDWKGIPVVADDRLALVLHALRQPPPEPIPAGLVGTLRPYQVDGYAWLSTLGRLGLGACLADDMGLGKTVQVIAHMLRRTELGGGPHLVVCPTSVLGNWARELRRFAPALKVLRHHGLQRDDEDLERADVVLTTYGLLVRDIEPLSGQQWDVVALDEAQAIKNPDSQRARCARLLQGRHRVAMSGTPVENRLDELWSLMEFLVPGLLGRRGRFRREVAVPIERFGDETVAHGLKLGVSPFLLRRLKSDPKVITDLPDKLERRDYCPLTTEQARLYEQVVEDAMERIGGAADIERRGHVLAMLTALKQVCNHPAHYLKEPGPLEGRSGKLDRCLYLLEAIWESGASALIFTQYREMGDRLQRYIEAYFDVEVPFLHGGTPAHKREEMVRVFQEDPDLTPFLLVSLRAGGTGLNLTRATHVIHYDRWWNPAVEDQATDRAYRIGQRFNVQVHKLICQGTLEERIDSLLEEKRALADQIVGGGERWVAELDDDALRSLVALGDDAVLE